MIVVMEVMKRKHFAKADIVNVQNQNSVVIMENVFQAVGVVVSIKKLRLNPSKCKIETD